MSFQVNPVQAFLRASSAPADWFIRIIVIIYRIISMDLGTGRAASALNIVYIRLALQYSGPTGLRYFYDTGNSNSPHH